MEIAPSRTFLMRPERPARHVQFQPSKPTGSNPGLGRIPRMRHPDIHPASLRSGRRRNGANITVSHHPEVRSNAMLIRSLGLVFITLLVIGGFMLAWLRSQMTHSADPSPVLPMDLPHAVSKFTSPSETEALTLVKQALTLRDPKHVSGCFRLGMTAPEDVVEFLRTAPERDGRAEQFEWLRSMDTDDMLIEGVLVRYLKDKVPGERLALLLPDDQGVWKLDFDSFARTCKPTWSDLLGGRADESEVRIFVAQDLYYNGPFQDDSKWTCFAMITPDIKTLLPEDQSLLRGYCRKGSPQAMAMERIFADSPGTNRVTVRIRRTEGADSRQYEITRVMARDWVTPRKPFDEKF